jgi:glycosyltransferase involved in cell wall biosynthesis
MGAGLLPFVSTAAGAALDLVADGESGILVEGFDPECWVQTIRPWLEAPDEMSRVGERARATVLARWTMDHAADAMLAGFKLGLLTHRSPRAAR